MFTKEERSSFKYWFAHWCAFQMTALNLKTWKPRFLLHDIEKPWHKLICNNYAKVQKRHRTHSNHHIEYALNHHFKGVDFLAMAIDWECSRFTKEAAQLNARDTLKLELGNLSESDGKKLKEGLEPVLDKLGL